MSVLSEVFDRCRAEGRAALIGYYPAGFPTLEGSIEAVRTMVADQPSLVLVNVRGYGPRSLWSLCNVVSKSEIRNVEKVSLLTREVAAVLRRVVRAGDHLGRYGGEEFVALLPGASVDAARASAERVRHAVESMDVRVAGMAMPLAASVGVAVRRPR